MLILIFGESCTGKSTLAQRLKARLGAELYSGATDPDGTVRQAAGG